MDFKTFYEKLLNYDAKRKKALNELTGLEYANSGDVIKAIKKLSKKSADMLLIKALRSGITFTGEELEELKEYVTEEELNDAIKISRPKLNEDQLVDLAEYMDEENIHDIVKFSKPCLDKEQTDALVDVLDEDELKEYGSRDHEKVKKIVEEEKHHKDHSILEDVKHTLGLDAEHKSKKKKKYKIGDYVWIRFNGQEGQIVGKYGGFYQVLITHSTKVESFSKSDFM